MKRTIPAPPDIAEGPPNDSEFLRSMHLHQESDCGFALIAAAWIDDSIQDVIRSRFIDNKKSVDELIVGDAPLATFSARIKLLYCMGIITDDEKKDLNIIRAIRNIFAHQRGRVSFTTREVKDRCLSLSLIAELKDFTHLDTKQPRTFFSAVAMHFIQYFMRMAQTVNRPTAGKGIKEYFEAIRAGIRQRAKEAREEQEESEE